MMCALVVQALNISSAMVNSSKVRVAVGIIQDDGRFLIAKRPEGKPYSGYWEFPGGKIEPHEEAYTALVRELHEELGITVTKAELWREHHHSYPDKSVELSLWRVLAYTGTPTPLENQTLMFATYQEMQSLQLLEGNISILKLLG